MTFQKYSQRIERLHYLIKLKATGPPTQFARKIGVSRSTLMEHLSEMKAMGAPIAYNHARGCYYYTEEVEFHAGFK